MRLESKHVDILRRTVRCMRRRRPHIGARIHRSMPVCRHRDLVFRTTDSDDDMHYRRTIACTDDSLQIMNGVCIEHG